MTDTAQSLRIETYHFADDGTVPNSALPLVVYRGALPDTGDRAAFCEEMFARNFWPDSWRNGIYPYHHYHSTAHEVLGIARGNARVRLGGESGRSVELREGDVVVIPAGVAHKREAASGDLLVIGSYPRGQSPDMCKAEPDRHDRAAASIATVPLPTADPVTGGAAPLLDCWGQGSNQGSNQGSRQRPA
ncbi:MAG TPA: cupin domain-containing protein [Stellaceae bacterium]|nr:cupin domain-containing protein [Stellaceae bacterium]